MISQVAGEAGSGCERRELPARSAAAKEAKDAAGFLVALKAPPVHLF